MRHRARRPFLDLVRRLPGAAAGPLGAVTRVRPLRAAGVLAVLVGVGTTAVVGVSAVHDDAHDQQARRAALGERPETSDASRGTTRPDLGDPSPVPGDSTPSPSATSPSPNASTPRTQHTSPTGDATDDPTPETSSPLPSQPTDDAPAPSSSSTSAPTSPTPRDTDPPQTSVSERYPSGDTAVFSLGADEPASFQCSVDGAAFSACTSAATYTDVNPGWHTFAVRAVDRAGNVDPTPAQVRWHANGGPDGE